MITFAAGCFQGRHLQQRVGLVDGQPITNANSQTLRTLDTPNSRRQLRAQEPSVDGFICQPPHRSQAHVDSREREVVLLQEEPIP